MNNYLHIIFLTKEVFGQTLNRKLALRSIFDCAKDDEVITVNPAHDLGKIYGKKSLEASNKVEVLTREELSLLLSTFQKYFPNGYPLVLTLARTGMRISEVIGLQWGDIDFQGRFIIIQRGLSRGKISTPKNGKSRRVDMSLQLTETLWRLKRDREREWGTDIPEWVFINGIGNPIQEQRWRSDLFNKALNKAELRHIGYHVLRHTYASLLIQDGVSLVYIKEQLGHSSIKITVDIYGHLVPGGNKEAVDRLDDSIESAPIRTLYAPGEISKSANISNLK